MLGSAGDWTAEALREFADDALVVALDREARPTSPPEALAMWVSAPTGDQAWSDMLSLVHPVDRGRVARTWWRSLEAPGAVVECDVRSDLPGMTSLRLQRIKFVNLLDDPDIKSIVLAIVDLGVVDEIPEAASVSADRFQAPKWAISYIDRVGNILHSAGLVMEVYGRTADDLIGSNVMETVHPESQDDGLDMWLEVVAAPGSTRTFQHRTLHPDGSTLWIESTVMNRLEPDGSGAIVTVSHDIESRRRELAALQESQEQFRMLAEDVPAAVFRANRWGRVEFGNARWHQMLDADGPIDRLHDLVHPDDRASFTDDWSQLFTGRGVEFGSEPIVFEIRTDQSGRTLSLSCRVAGTGVDGRNTVIGAMHDVTATNELQYRADHDPLTGLHNRLAFDRRLAEVLADEDAVRPAAGPAGSATGWAVIFVDLDGFKQVNDEHGHEAGDLVLRTIAQRLRSALRPGDVVARYGGDEFVVLCLAVPDEGEQVVTERIERVLTDPVVWDGGGWLPRASIGVARPEPGDKPETILRRADGAMYETKRTRQSG